MGVGIEKADIRRLLQDEALIDEVVKKALDDPEIVDNLASDVADELSDELGDDPELRKKIIGKASKGDAFKKRVIKKLVDDMS